MPNDNLKNIEQAILSLAVATQKNAIISATEVGTIVAYGGAVAPTDWLLCDGTAISRTQFSALFSIIGTSFGVGDGSTTFNLPNLKGKNPMGYDSTQTEFNALGKTGGEKAHTLTVAEMPSHSHSLTNLGNTLLVNAGASSGAYIGSGTKSTDANGGGGSHNVLDPYVTTNYIIRSNPPTTVTIQDNPYMFHVWRNAAQNTGAGAFAVLACDTEVFDLSNSVSSGVFTAPVSGYYQFNWLAGVITSGVQQFVASLFINGSRYSDGGTITINTSDAPSSGADTVKMLAGETADVRVYCTGARPVNVGNIAYNRFSGFLVAPL